MDIISLQMDHVVMKPRRFENENEIQKDEKCNLLTLQN